MNKFKVGDFVVGTLASDSEYLYTNSCTVCKVVSVYDKNALGDDMKIALPLDEGEFDVCSDFFQPLDGLFTKSRKTSIEEFWNAKETLGVVCKTFEEAAKFCCASAKLGKTWKGGKSYMECVNFKIGGTVYTNRGMYDSVEEYPSPYIKVIYFENIDFS